MVSSLKKITFWLGSAAAVSLLAACGGGGGSDAQITQINGTAARGAPLVGAVISLQCAYGGASNVLSDASGSFSIEAVNLAYPCIGQATLGSITYRGALFEGGRFNITPMTELLVKVIETNVQQASGGGAGTDFMAALRANSGLAQSVVTKANEYREATVELVRTQLIAVLGEAEAQAIVNSFGSSFDSVAFTADPGTSPYDAALEQLTVAGVVSASGAISASVIEAAEQAGEELPAPTPGGTGAAGG